MTETEATVTMDDGSTSAISLPQMISIEVGMPVTVVETGDDKPIYRWGD
jgi:hypothetical protein